MELGMVIDSRLREIVKRGLTWVGDLDDEDDEERLLKDLLYNIYRIEIIAGDLQHLIATYIYPHIR